MTPSLRYIATRYETCIDRGLDVEAIRLHLAAHGIRRTPGQVSYDLNDVFCFAGYAANHPAPAPAQSVKEFDKAIDRGPG